MAPFRSVAVLVALVVVASCLGVLPTLTLPAHRLSPSPSIAGSTSAKAPSSVSAVGPAPASHSLSPRGGELGVNSAPPFRSVRMGHFTIPGPHPQSWEGSPIPPGAPWPVGWSPAARPSDSGNGSGNETASMNSSIFGSGHCAGLYPVTGNSTYYDDCIGHDEPGIQFYSDLPGSGGNVTWNVTLPLDNGVGQNQSNLYVAIWFGMSLSDPLAWMDQCFLELQFYPDSLYNYPGANSYAEEGKWVAAAVAWQIEAVSGYEDPCYYNPLYTNGIPGPGYFNMTQGDRLTVTMSGWTNDPYGENITVVDHTSGTKSNTTLWDPYGNFPLDPAYRTSSFENGLEWTPGGEFPVAFAFETGHGRDPTNPSNPAFNYCTPGRPPASASNPYVPCPSYDAPSWVNDSVAPWRIGVPTFFNGSTRQTPAEVGFSQDLGGIAYTDSFTGCPGNEGSTYCSYPWYSFSCSTDSFQFGATDYPGVTDDFGKFAQYSTSYEKDGLGFGYYPPTNFTIPTCGNPSAAVQVSAVGAAGAHVSFLSTSVQAPTNFTGLALGRYGIHALAVGSGGFSSWRTTGSVTVVPSTSAWATVNVSGSGTIVAQYSLAPSTTKLVFVDSGASGAGHAAVFPSNLLTATGLPLATLANNSSLSLASQVYSIVAYPPSGYNFSEWVVSNAGATVAAPEFPGTWMIVTGLAALVTIRAEYVGSSLTESVGVYPTGSGTGTVSLGGTTSSSSFSVSLKVGDYPIVATPSSGSEFDGWTYGIPLVLADLGSHSNLTVEGGGYGYVYAYFEPRRVVTLDDSPATGGGISANSGPVYPNGSVLSSSNPPSQLTAVPSTGYSFVSWSVNNTAAIDLTSPHLVETSLLENASGTITAHFAPVTASNRISFDLTPASAGFANFNFQSYSNGSSNSSVANGSYFLSIVPNPGFSATVLNLSGPLSLSGNVLTVSGTGGVVGATFAPWTATVPVTFVSVPNTGTSFEFNHTSVPYGSTVWVRPGVYPLAVNLSAGSTFSSWTTTEYASVANASAPSTTLTVVGGSSVFALRALFHVSGVSISPSPDEVGFSFEMNAFANGTSSSYNYTWSGLPPGCGNSVITVPVNHLWCTSPNATGTFPIGLTVTDGTGASIVFPAIPLVIAPHPQVAHFSAIPSTVTVGVLSVFNVSVAGGVGPYRFSYGNLPIGCLSANQSRLPCASTVAQTYTVEVLVRDQFGVTASANTTLTVNPMPSLTSLTFTPSVVTVGYPTVISASVSGGTAPLSVHFSNLPAACSAPSSTTFTCVPGAPGTYQISANVTDAFGVTNSTSSWLVVNAAVVISSFTATPVEFTIGNGTVLAVSAGGGTGPLTYVFSGLPTGCVSSNTTLLSCRPTVTGTFNVTVTVTDRFGSNSTMTVSLDVVKPHHTQPQPTASSPPPGPSYVEWIALGVVLAALLAILAFVLRRRNSSSPPAPPSPPGPMTGEPGADEAGPP